MAANKKLKKNTAVLPIDFIETILLRLPIKSLFRFKTVCKSWQALISDHRFSEIYNVQKSKCRDVFLIKRGGTFSLIKLENNKFTESVLRNPLGDYIPLCSCNGIVVLLKTRSNRYTYNEYRLWNPTIGRYTAGISCPHKLEGFWIKYGLYHDSRTDDYRFVIISAKHYTVFSCKSGTWSEKKPFPRSGLETYTGVFVDGSFYMWGDFSLWQGELVQFDLRDETSKKLRKPDDLITNERDYVRLATLSGRLCLYRMDGDRTQLRLWIMENHGGDDRQNYCWRELVNIEREDLRFCRPTCLTNEYDVVMRVTSSLFVVYNHREKRFQESWRFRGLFSRELLLYSESTFFPSLSIKSLIEEEAGD